jgi:hypothetical protein
MEATMFPFKDVPTGPHIFERPYRDPRPLMRKTDQTGPQRKMPRALADKISQTKRNADLIMEKLKKQRAKKK